MQSFWAEETFRNIQFLLTPDFWTLVYVYIKYE